MFWLEPKELQRRATSVYMVEKYFRFKGCCNIVLLALSTQHLKMEFYGDVFTAFMEYVKTMHLKNNSLNTDEICTINHRHL